jgi:glycosidase
MRDAFSMLTALPTSIVLYYGDEIGLKNTPLHLGESDSRLVGRGEFDWTKAQQQRRDPDSLFNFTRQALAKRKRP